MEVSFRGKQRIRFFKKIGAYLQTLKSGEVGGGRAWGRRGQWQPS
jgi:hypothetical protein